MDDELTTFLPGVDMLRVFANTVAEPRVAAFGKGPKRHMTFVDIELAERRLLPAAKTGE